MKKKYFVRWQFIKTTAVAVAVGGLALAVGSCMDDPSPVGSALLPPGDYLQIDSTTLAAQTSWSASAYVPSSVSGYLMIGRADGIQSWGMLRFTYLPDTLASATILSARLTLRGRYSFGDPGAPFSFRIHRALMEFATDSLTLDSVRAAGFYEPTSSPEAVFGSLVDTAEITAQLDTGLVAQWLRSTSDAPEYGMILEPTNMNVIRGFARFSLVDSTGPLLNITYRMTDTSSVDTAMFVLGLDRWVAALDDTSFATSTQRMYVRNGVAFRGIVGFDASSIPPHAAIHQAILSVTLDPSQSEFNNYTVDSLKAVFISQAGYEDLVYYINDPPSTVNGVTTYRFNISLIVQAWVRGSMPQQIALAGLDEESAFDEFVLNGVGAADSTLRPSLHVYYSVAQ